MNIQTFAKLIRQSPHTVYRRILNKEIPARKVHIPNAKMHTYWDISDKWIRKLLSGKKDK